MLFSVSFEPVVCSDMNAYTPAASTAAASVAASTADAASDAAADAGDAAVAAIAAARFATRTAAAAGTAAVAHAATEAAASTAPTDTDRKRPFSPSPALVEAAAALFDWPSHTEFAPAPAAAAAAPAAAAAAATASDPPAVRMTFPDALAVMNAELEAARTNDLSFADLKTLRARLLSAHSRLWDACATAGGPRAWDKEGVPLPEEQTRLVARRIDNAFECAIRRVIDKEQLAITIREAESKNPDSKFIVATGVVGTDVYWSIEYKRIWDEIVYPLTNPVNQWDDGGFPSVFSVLFGTGAAVRRTTYGSDDDADDGGDVDGDNNQESASSDTAVLSCAEDNDADEASKRRADRAQCTRKAKRTKRATRPIPLHLYCERAGPRGKLPAELKGRIHDVEMAPSLDDLQRVDE